MIRIGGLKPDPEDKRDGLYSWGERYGSNAIIEPSADLFLNHQLIRDQIGNSCTGFSSQYAFRQSYFYETGEDPGELSGMFPYFIGRAVWGGQDRDDGSYLRTTLKAIQLQGICLEKVFSDQVPWDKMPTWRATKNAFKFRGLRNFRRIYTEEEARSALSMKQSLVGGWQIGEDWVDWDGKEAFNVETKKIGGHAMCVSGYSPEGDFWSPGSWGTHGDKTNRPLGDPARPGFWRMTPEFLISAHTLFALDMTPNE